MIVIHHKPTDYKEQVQSQVLNFLMAHHCGQYFSGSIFDRFYRKYVKMGIRPMSELSSLISDEIIMNSAPVAPIEEDY